MTHRGPHASPGKLARSKHWEQKGLCWYCGTRCQVRRPYDDEPARPSDARAERLRTPGGIRIQAIMTCRACQDDKAGWSAVLTDASLT